MKSADIGSANDKFIATQESVETQPKSQEKSMPNVQSYDDTLGYDDERELKKMLRKEKRVHIDPRTKIKLYFILATIFLILVQILLIKWWTLLTGPVTILLAVGIYKIFSDPIGVIERVLEMIMDNLALSIFIVIGIVAVVIQIVTLGWWSILTGVVTIVVLALLYHLLDSLF